MTSVANSELDERVYGHHGSPQLKNGFAWDEICKTVAADVELWEAYIKVPFYLISNVARIMGSPLSSPLVIIKEHPKAWRMHCCIFFPLQ